MINFQEGSEKCFLCGSTQNLTRDHVPPANLFKPPLPTDIITVPSCLTCNGSYSLDEEYFRACVATQGYWNPIGEWIWDNKVVGSTFHRSPALKKTITSTYVNVPVRTPSGLYLGEQGALHYRVDRLQRVIEKICRGLFTHHHPEVDLSDVLFEVNMTRISGDIKSILQLLKRDSIGGDTFVYWRGIGEEDPRQSLWFFLFYTQTLFTATTKGKQSNGDGT